MDGLISEIRDIQRPYMHGEGVGDVVLVCHVVFPPFRSFDLKISLLQRNPNQINNARRQQQTGSARPHPTMFL